MIKLSQRDPRWSNVTLGHTNYSIGRWGCLVTSLSMWSGIMPDVLAKEYSFTDEGYLLWQSITAPLTFLHRQYNSDGLEEAFDDGKAVVVEVEGRHWVAYLGDGRCNDPWLGDECDILSRYKSITGYAKLDLAPVVPEWFAVHYEWALENGIITEDSKLTEEFMRAITILHRYDGLHHPTHNS